MNLVTKGRRLPLQVLVTLPKRFNKAGNVANLYDLLMIPTNASKDQIKDAYNSKVKYYDPDVTGDRSTL